MTKLSFLLLISLFAHHIIGQQTVGLFLNSDEAQEGYTLFSPLVNNKTYLIDNCGEKVHSWPSSHTPGLSAYLLDNGILLRAGRKTGGSGIIEMIDWDGNVIWSYSSSNNFSRQHHDFEYLPNGNILLIVWDNRTSDEVELAGSFTNNTNIFSEQIIEIKPNLETGETTVVWQWKAWDHLVQDKDSTKENFGVIAERPEKIDINFLNHDVQDWLHFNGVDYNEDLDQIIVSTRNFNEFWIIDHSTSTAESASSNGGKYGKGGDLLYRWGNPAAYNRGDVSDQQLFLQHHPHWIPNNYADEGKIMVFNNQAGNPQNQNYSTVNIIDLPVDEDGFYTYSEGAYEPSDFDWTYQAPNPTDFYSQVISGAERLANGNTLICEGTPGRLFEINEAKEIVWEYVNPVNNLGPIAQNTVPLNNNVFRCIRYSADYPGLADRALIPQGYIETGSTFTCNLTSTKSELHNDSGLSIHLYPNPATEYLNIRLDNDFHLSEIIDTKIYNVDSKLVYQSSQPKSKIDLEGMSSGLYFIQFTFKNEQVTKRFIVQ